MGVVDMPLDELRVYMGKSPCPDDFDQFWITSLAEMEAVDPDVAMTKAEFQCNVADCYDLYFTGVGGSRIYSKLMVPKAKLNNPVLFQFHGYSGNSGDWVGLLPYASQGFVVAAVDCRGQGGKSEDMGNVKGTTYRGHIVRGLDDCAEKLLFRQIFLDTAQLVKVVSAMDIADADRMVVCGGSQGGALTLACSALCGDKIKKAFSAYPFLSDYQRVWELDTRTNAYMELWDFFRRFDPNHENEDAIFNRLGYIDVHHLAKKITAVVTMAISLRDETCPPSTQFAAYNNISSDKNMYLYHDFGHETLPLLGDRMFCWLTDI